MEIEIISCNPKKNELDRVSGEVNTDNEIIDMMKSIGGEEFKIKINNPTNPTKK